MLRSPGYSERIQRIDPRTGIRVIQITSYPTPSTTLRYEWPIVTPDNGRVFLMCQREARRGAPWDVFRCDADGLFLFQLTERDQGKHPPVFDKQNAPVSILTLDGKTLYVLWNGDPHVYAVDAVTGATEPVASLERVCLPGALYQHTRLSISGDRLFVVFRKPGIGAARVDLRTGEATELRLNGLLWACHTREPRLIIWRKTDAGGAALPDYVSFVRGAGQPAFWTVDEDGSDERFLSIDPFSHGAILGTTGLLQGCGMPPDRCLWLVEEGMPPRRIADGPYFWHSGASFDGEWVLTDTNWPEVGLQLIHVPTGHFRTLCQPHTGEVHSHPALSHDGRVALFSAGSTEISQVHVAHITDEFRESVIAGELDNPRDKWL